MERESRGRGEGEAKFHFQTLRAKPMEVSHSG